jgi:type II secretory pathway component PulC
MKINIFKKKNNFKKKNDTPNPNMYWELAIFSTFIVIIAASIFGYNTFSQTNKESDLPAVKDSGQVPTVNKGRIQNVLNYFSEREQNSTQILNSPVSVVDPSL